MEEQKRNEISIQQAFYLLKHFEVITENDFSLLLKNDKTASEINSQLQIIGSKFNSNFCRSPFELSLKLSEGMEVRSIIQSNGRIAKEFEYDMVVGADNLISIDKLSQLEQQSIVIEKRGDWEVKVVKLTQNISTNLLTAIYSEDGKIITCFPGQYAPPFPRLDLTQAENEQSRAFWDTHAFIVLG